MASKLSNGAANRLPPGTRHKKKPQPKVVLPASSSKLTPEQQETIQREVDLLPVFIDIHYDSWKAGAKPFQLACMGAQVLGRDVLLHAATGAGKTGIAAGPHLLPSSKGKVTLVVSPLLSLHEEQVCTSCL